MTTVLQNKKLFL